MRTQIIHKIEEARLMAIIRLKEISGLERLLDNLVLSGITVMEITSNTPGYAAAIRETRRKYPDLLIGAGTITNSRLAGEAISADAQFLVTPNINREVVTVAHRHGIPVLMGAMTPTDITAAIEYEADFIKLFPAGPLGIDYLKSLRGPFDKTKFFAVGGIDLRNAAAWLAAGVSGVGIGSSLTSSDPKDVREQISSLFKKIKVSV